MTRLAYTVSLVASSAVGICTIASAADQSSDVTARIAELKREVATLKGDAAAWLTEARAAEIRGIVRDVLADADTRASLQGATGSGYNGGFFLSSADGNYSMKMNVLEQIRWTFNDQSDVNDEQISGFENKRTRLTFGGNMVDTTWTYRLAYNIAYSNSAEDFGADELSDAFVQKDFECGASMTVGQFKLPFSSEYDIDVGNMQFMDYSTVDAFYRAGYGQGIKFDYESDFTRFGIAYVNAIRDANDPWGPGSPEDQWAVSTRLDLKFAGNWGQFTRGQSWKGDGYGVKVGVGAYSLSENTPPGIDATALTFDTSVNFGGANLTAAYYWNQVDNTGTAADGANPTGFIVAGGVFVTDDWELVARYESSSVDLNLGGAEDFGALTLGGNCYLSRNQSKFSVDFGYAFDAVSAIYAPFAISNNWIEDPAGEDGQWLIRTQLSFSF
ncbi:MAG: hypothetical protein RIT24_2826 [Planctomycetota bacterium]|jgi:hypothetical protein